MTFIAPSDSHGVIPMSERVVEVARYTKDNDHAKRRYEHYYQCPEHGVSVLPCFCWWTPRGFGTPHKPKAPVEARRRPKGKGHKPRALCP